ncbi:MAG: MmgE/PrpD family protein [Pigmentiphaga sp.]|uniref:MmgE/PrpD family protein n=1 Tax=Pigmentiphaga sp. TaxID=1977564 RepID=UPI003B56CA53
MAAPTETSLSQWLGDRLAAAARTGLPADAMESARRLILDTRMVAWAGAAQPDVIAVRELTVRNGGAAQSSIWSGPWKVPAAEAAFVNALSASALDYDSLHANVHPDAIVAAAAWAVGESVRATGREVLQAYALGSELVCRLADAVSGPQKGWTIGAVLGTFGAAGAAALLMRLPPQQITHALGLCLSMAAGSQQANVEQVLAKRLQPALAARSGVQAALLAQAGMTAPAQAFEGRFGLWNLYFPSDRERFSDRFGVRFSLRETGLKKYPVCACSHAALDALHAVLRQGGIQLDDIARIEARISPFMDRLVGGAFSPAAHPQVTGQFSLRYGLASIALRGRLGLAEIAPAAVLDPGIAGIVDRIHLAVDTRNPGELAPATVRLTLRSGQAIEHTVATMPGGPAAPMSVAELERKYLECAAVQAAENAPSLVAGEIARLASMDQLDDINHWAAAGNAKPARGI